MDWLDAVSQVIPKGHPQERMVRDSRLSNSVASRNTDGYKLPDARTDKEEGLEYVPTPLEIASPRQWSGAARMAGKAAMSLLEEGLAPKVGRAAQEGAVKILVDDSRNAGSVPLQDQAKRMLRRDLTEDEIKRMDRASEQGYNLVGWHYGDFSKDLPNKFNKTGEKAAFHIDPTPNSGQAIHRKSFYEANYGRDGEDIKLVVARVNNPARVTDTKINNLGRGQKGKLQESGSTGALYPNDVEMSSKGKDSADLNRPRDFFISHIPASGAFQNQPLESNVTINPSFAIFHPKDVRLFEANFDPKKTDDVGYLLSAGIGAPLSKKE